MGEVYTTIVMVLNMMENGRMINRMGKVLKFGLVYLNFFLFQYINIDGAKYEGSYKNGEKNGKGKLIFQDKS